MSILNTIFDRGDQPGSRTFPFVVLLLVVTFYSSISNLVFPADSMFYVSTYTITLLGKYLCYAMLASWRLLCARWLCYGHVLDAPNW